MHVHGIGGQTCVNLCKPGKLFWGPKRDLAGSCKVLLACRIIPDQAPSRVPAPRVPTAPLPTCS